MFLYSAVSSLLDCSKRCTLHPLRPCSFPDPIPTLGRIQSPCHFHLICSFPVIFLANFVHPLYSQYFPQALINKCLDPFQHWLVHSACFRSVNSNTGLIFVLNRRICRCFADYPGLPHVSQNMECCPRFADSCLYVSLCPSSCVHYTN